MTARYQTVRVDDVDLREGMKTMAHKRRRFGYRRLHVLLRREGHVVNHKRLFRMYREEKLMCGTGVAGNGPLARGVRCWCRWPQISSGRWILCRIN